MDSNQQVRKEPTPGTRPVFPNQIPNVQQVVNSQRVQQPTQPVVQQPQVQQAPVPAQPSIQPQQVQQQAPQVQPVQSQVNVPQDVQQYDEQQFDQELVDQQQFNQPDQPQDPAQFDPGGVPLPNVSPLRSNGLSLLLIVGAISIVMYLVMRFVL